VGGTEADPVEPDGDGVEPDDDQAEGPPQSTFAWWDVWEEDEGRKKPLRQLPSIVWSAIRFVWRADRFSSLITAGNDVVSAFAGAVQVLVIGDRLDDRPAIEDAARQAGAHAMIERLSDGYDTVLGRLFDAGHDLSVGQWQRVALARAFFRDAPVVVLDEPTAALDARAEHELFARIRALLAGRTVVLISHRFSTVRSADHIYVLHRGRVTEHGSHDELMAASGTYAELFSLQASAFTNPGGRRARPW
jgi:ABC-type multidrug transport system fused ATPase/permease subunit